MKYNTITALDVGSHSIKVIQATPAKDDKIAINSIVQLPAEGLERGLVRDIGAVSSCIRKALNEAETLSEIKANNIYASISGEHVRTSVADGRVSIPSLSGNEPGEITEEHLEQVIEESQNIVKIQKANDRCRILHSFAQAYSIDGHEDIRNPLNMNGFLLVARVCSILAEITPLRNLTKSIELAGYTVQPENIVLSHIAAAESVLSSDEKRLGCILIDMGSGTSDIAIYNRSVLERIMVVPQAGALITEDLAIGLKTPISSAEYLKKEYGSANAANVDPNLEVEVEGISNRPSSSKKASLISHVIQHRVDDILSSCYQKTVEYYTPELVTAGIVLTGGTANLQGIAEQIQYSYNLPVKISRPSTEGFSGQTSALFDPAFSVAAGLVRYATNSIYSANRMSSLNLVTNHSGKLLEKFKQFLKEFS